MSLTVSLGGLNSLVISKAMLTKRKIIRGFFELFL